MIRSNESTVATHSEPIRKFNDESTVYVWPPQTNSTPIIQKKKPDSQHTETSPQESIKLPSSSPPSGISKFKQIKQKFEHTTKTGNQGKKKTHTNLLDLQKFQNFGSVTRGFMKRKKKRESPQTLGDEKHS